MRNELFLSIILPVYKGEELLVGCITNLCNQDLDTNDYEIIVVDDGSPDNSSAIIKDLIRIHPNIVLIEQNNRGVACARNRGMEIAKGRWLTFIDHDDLFRVGSLRILRKLLENSSDEIVKFSIEDLSSSNYKSHIAYKQEHELIKSEIGINFYHWYRDCGINTGIDSCWSIFYNSDFINKYNLRFLEGIIYLEDAEFLGRVFCLAERCSFFNFPFYLHYDNPGSVTNSKMIFSDRAINGFIECAQNIKKFKDNSKLNYYQRVFLNNLIVKFAILVLQQPITNKEFDWKRYKWLCKMLKKNNLQRVDIEGCSHDLTYWGRIYNFSKLMFMFMWFGYLAKTSIQSRFQFSKDPH